MKNDYSGFVSNYVWCNMFIVFISSFSIVVLLLSQDARRADAKVSGQCGHCHTMHNSQDGTSVAREGAGTGWDGTGRITGPKALNPLDKLLVSNCVGCHSSTTSDTTITVGNTRVPVVFNTVEPLKPLAGGNFFWIANESDNSKGHNVYGISGSDTLVEAPGKNPAACSDNTCHMTLAAAPQFGNYDRGGCQGCHVFTYHHEDNGVYRFLKGHGSSPPFSPTLPDTRKNIVSYPDYVKGWEDNDWEYTTSQTDHNYYKGTNDTSYTSSGTSLQTYQTITAFCSGCHSIFHGPFRNSGDGMFGATGMWTRHPTDILFPDTDEYSTYDPDTNYSFETPVAWNITDFSSQPNPTRDQAVVMCLSCHRPHGSNQPDMLRWTYSDMESGTSGLAAGTGCFRCHSEKDGI